MKDHNLPWQKWVLDAIRKIRAQKQRPSVERICRAIRQHQDQSETAIKDHLEALVKEGHVLKVFNKGQCSYKDPSGNIHLPRPSPAPKEKETPKVKEQKETKESDTGKQPRVKREKKRSSAATEESPKESFPENDTIELPSQTLNSMEQVTEEEIFAHCSLFYKNFPNSANLERFFDDLPPSLGSTPKRLKLIEETCHKYDTFGCYVATVLKSLPAQNAMTAQKNILSLLCSEEKKAASSSILQSFYHFIIAPA